MRLVHVLMRLLHVLIMTVVFIPGLLGWLQGLGSNREKKRKKKKSYLYAPKTAVYKLLWLFPSIPFPLGLKMVQAVYFITVGIPRQDPCDSSCSPSPRSSPCPASVSGSTQGSTSSHVPTKENQSHLGCNACCWCLLDSILRNKYKKIIKLVSYTFDSHTLTCIKQHKKSQGRFLWNEVLVSIRQDCRSSYANYIYLLSGCTYRINIWSSGKSIW